MQKQSTCVQRHYRKTRINLHVCVCRCRSAFGTITISINYDFLATTTHTCHTCSMTFRFDSTVCVSVFVSKLLAGGHLHNFCAHMLSHARQSTSICPKSSYHTRERVNDATPDVPAPAPSPNGPSHFSL